MEYPPLLSMQVYSTPHNKRQVARKGDIRQSLAPRAAQVRLTYRHTLTTDTLDQMLYRLGDWAGITGVRCSAHMFRHTFAVNYLMAGGDVYLLSRILGHTHLSITEIYLRAVKSADVRHARFSLTDRIGS